MRKTIVAACACALLLLCACGVSGVNVEVEKSQEINVLNAEGKLINTLSSKSELDEFFDIFDSEDWDEIVRLPEGVVKRGELVVRQTETLKFGQSPDSLQMEELCRLCVYDAPYITLELAGVRLCFAASGTAIEYFDTLFE